MGTDGTVEAAIAAVRAGLPILLPTDTVYGLVTSAERDDYTARLYRLKGREDTQPSALLTASLETLFECLPELDERAATIAHALLPGGFTLILPNPARRFRWLTGTRTDTIGIRVPLLSDASRLVVEAARCTVATSANEPGGPDPMTLDDVPRRIRDACAAEVDVGPLPGKPSTVIDFTRDAPHVLREGAEPSEAALARVREALAA